MKNFILGIIVISGLGCANLNAQQTVLDGVYVNENTPSRKVIPYTNLRQADVMWSKRIWRRMDLRKKQNQVFYYPEEPAQGRKNLFDYIRQAILDDGTLTPYDPGTVVDIDDEFTRALTTEDVLAKMISESEIDVFDEYGDVVGTQKVRDTLRASSVKFYEIKEELEVRVIGIKPMVEKINASGDPVLEDLFWIYFPEARFVFANSEVFNRINDAERRTYEDVFWKRQFESTVIKESNVYDRSINEYKTGLDALLEAEKIEEKIFNFEHDFWHY